MNIKLEEIKDSDMSQLYFRSISLFFSLYESELRGYISMIAILLWALVPNKDPLYGFGMYRPPKLDQVNQQTRQLIMQFIFEGRQFIYI